MPGKKRHPNYNMHLSAKYSCWSQVVNIIIILLFICECHMAYVSATCTTDSARFVRGLTPSCASQPPSFH